MDDSKKRKEKARFIFCFGVNGSLNRKDSRKSTIGYEALELYCGLNKINPQGEAYLSAFNFAKDFDDYLIKNKTVEDYDGDCYSDLIWFDIDDADLDAALDAARKLVAAIINLDVLPHNILIFFTGKKGFCVGIPSYLVDSMPSRIYNEECKRFCFAIGSIAGIKIDPMIYAKVQPLRAPNSRHQKTGLHKIQLDHKELFSLTIDEIKCLAAKPRRYELGQVFERDAEKNDWKWGEWGQWGSLIHSLEDSVNEKLNAIWQNSNTDMMTTTTTEATTTTNPKSAMATTATTTEATQLAMGTNIDATGADRRPLRRTATTIDPTAITTTTATTIDPTAITTTTSTINSTTKIPHLNKSTKHFCCHSAKAGEGRRMKIFAVAANLAEMGHSREQIYAWMGEAAEDTGLPITEVREQIEAGIKYGLKKYGNRE